MRAAERAYQWLNERLNIEPLLAPLRHKTVPSHRYSFCYLFGGMAVTLMVVQVLSGLLLMFYYRPTMAEAHASIVRIMAAVPAGSMIRSVHSWSASLLVMVLFCHALTTLLMAAYRRPRELTWITGLCLFGLVMAFAFSGYLLPWNQRSYSATRVGTDLAGQVPLLGGLIKGLLRGGDEVGPDTLTRFFALHVTILPLILLALMSIHLWLIQRQSVSSPESVGHNCPLIPFFPDYLLRDMIAGLGLLAALVTLALAAPTDVGVQADVLKPDPEGIAPEWFFLFLFQTIKALPQTIAGINQAVLVVCVSALVALAFLVLPLIDSTRPAGRLRTAIRAGAVVLACYAAAMTIYSLIVLPKVEPALEQPAEATLADWIAYVSFLAVVAVAITALALLVRHRQQLRRMGLFAPPAVALKEPAK